MTKKEQRINRLFLFAGILTLLYYLGQGITVRFGQSLLYLWLMLSAVCFGRFFLWKWAWKRGKSAPIPRPWLRAVNIVVIAAVAVFLAVECLVFSGAFRTPPEGLDAIIVLGARVDENGPSGSLRQRISAARVYLEENPDTVCIASGGQGEDEPMSEAECIRDHLVAGGIDPDRIFLEDRSTSTEENMRYSLPMLHALEEDAERVGIVTNDFHIFRALCLARKNGGFTFYGVPARSTVFGFIHYAMREFFTLRVSLVRGYI